MKKGIDVSSHNGNINWGIVKNEIDFAIIRLGYGDNVERQDDIQYMNNIRGCIENNIPFGVYIYSYATNLSGEASVTSEIEHTKRQLSKLSQKPFCVYYDLEDDSTTKLGKQMLTYFALEFCKEITNAGYKAGIYANENWCKNYLDVKKIEEMGYSIWCAKYSSYKPNIASGYDIWQYGDNGSINGIPSNQVDMNYLYNESILNGSSSTNVKPQTSGNNITYQTYDDVKKKWLPNVVNDTDYAGIYGHDVDCVYCNLDNGDIEYKVHYKGGNWLPSVINRSDYAGIYNKPIDGFMAKTNEFEYRVHLRTKNKWLSWVSGYNENDSMYGYAGILGQEIDGIQFRKK